LFEFRASLDTFWARLLLVTPHYAAVIMRNATPCIVTPWSERRQRSLRAIGRSWNLWGTIRN